MGQADAAAIFDDLYAKAVEHGADELRASVTTAYMSFLASDMEERARAARDGVLADLEDAAAGCGARLEGVEESVKDAGSLASKLWSRACPAVLDPFLEGGLPSAILACSGGVRDALRFSVVSAPPAGDAVPAVLGGLSARGYAVLSVRDLDADALTMLSGTCAELAAPHGVPFEVMFHDEAGYAGTCAARSDGVGARSALLGDALRVDSPDERYYLAGVGAEGIRVPGKLVRLREGEHAPEVFDGWLLSWVPDVWGLYLREVLFGTGLSRTSSREEAARLLERCYGVPDAA